MRLTRQEQITRIITDESVDFYVVSTSAYRMIKKLEKLGYQGHVATKDGLPTPYIEFFVKRKHIRFLSNFDKRSTPELSQLRREHMLKMHAEGRLRKATDQTNFEESVEEI